MTTRRAVVAGVPLTILSGVCAHAESDTDHGPGCWTPDDKVQPLFRRVGRPNSFAFGSEDLEPRSGNRALDRALAQGLATISRTFDVLPGFAYYREEDGQPNAQATPEMLLERTDGTVMFGLTLLELLLRRENPDAAILAVCAHEFGHIVSYKNGMIDDLAPSRFEPYRAEQFADYMAGFFAGSRRLLHPDYPAVVFATTQNSFGGGDHGSGEQRAEAVQEGFLTAYQRQLGSQDAIQAAFDFSIVRQL